MSPLHPRLLLIQLSAALLWGPQQGWALSSDRQQPMHIEADQAELDEQKGVSIYTGNVQVTQGTLVLTGDTMTVYNVDEDIERVIMLGQPATYRQRPDGKDEDMHAKSLRMEYFATPERIILLREAVAWQGKNVFRSDRIVYDVALDRVNAGNASGDQRVRITLQPKPQPETQTTPESESAPQAQTATDTP